MEKEPPYQFIGVNWDYDGHGHIKIKSEKTESKNLPDTQTQEWHNSPAWTS